MTWTSSTDYLRTLEQHAEKIAATGAPLPAAYIAARGAYDAMATDTARATTDLLGAIEHGNADAVPALALAAALAEADLVAPLKDKLSRDLVGALRRAWATDAQPTYEFIATKFDAAAKALTEAVKIVDPEVDGASLVGKEKRVQTAWLDAQIHAAELDALLPALAAAAELAGMRFPMTDGPDAKRRDPEFMLTCIPGRAHRRRVWSAWDSRGGRTGRWGSLAALGVTIKAARPGEQRGYNRPPAIQVKSVLHSQGGFTGSRSQEYDPCDDEFAGTPADTTEQTRAPRRVQG